MRVIYNILKVADVIKRKLRKLESLLTDGHMLLELTNNDLNLMQENENDELTIVGLRHGEDIFSYSAREEGETSNSEEENSTHKQKQGAQVNN